MKKWMEKHRNKIITAAALASAVNLEGGQSILDNNKADMAKNKIEATSTFNKTGLTPRKQVEEHMVDLDIAKDATDVANKNIHEPAAPEWENKEEFLFTAKGQFGLANAPLESVELNYEKHKSLDDVYNELAERGFSEMRGIDYLLDIYGKEQTNKILARLYREGSLLQFIDLTKPIKLERGDFDDDTLAQYFSDKFKILVNNDLFREKPIRKFFLSYNNPKTIKWYIRHELGHAFTAPGILTAIKNGKDNKIINPDMPSLKGLDFTKYLEDLNGSKQLTLGMIMAESYLRQEGEAYNRILEIARDLKYSPLSADNIDSGINELYKRALANEKKLGDNVIYIHLLNDPDDFVRKRMRRIFIYAFTNWAGNLENKSSDNNKA